MIGRDADNPRRFALLDGGLSRAIRCHGVQIVVAPEHAEPFPVDAVIVEEDTHLVLGAPVRLRDESAHPIRLMTALRDIEPHRAGEVVVHSGPPARLLAIVHDLEQEPFFREEWLVSALDGIFYQAGKLGSRSLQLPLLGCHYGGLRPARFAALLRRALDGPAAPALQRLWLVATAPDHAELLAVLRG